MLSVNSKKNVLDQNLIGTTNGVLYSAAVQKNLDASLNHSGRYLNLSFRPVTRFRKYRVCHGTSTVYFPIIGHNRR